MQLNERQRLVNMVVDYIEDRCSKEGLEVSGLLLLSPIALKEARMFGNVVDDGVYVEVAPGLWQSDEDYRANMAFDEDRDNQQAYGDK